MATLLEIDCPYPGRIGIAGIRARIFDINAALTRIDHGPRA